MDKLLKHIYKRFEYIYYTQNPGINTTDSNCFNNNSDYCCLKTEGLDCNCIPAIILHYMGYIYSGFFNISSIKTYFKTSDTISYMQIKCDDKALVPIFSNEPDSKNCYWENFICKRSAISSKLIYIPFRKYQNINDLNTEIQNLQIMKPVICSNYLNGYNIKFWECFLMAMRIQQIEKCSRAFLSMSIFMFPFRTLQHVITALKNGHISNSAQLKLAEFLYDYIAFIRNLADNEIGIFFCITQEFQRLTSIDLSFFIEHISNNDKIAIPESHLEKLFLTAYDNNLQALTRRKGEFKVLFQKLKTCGLPQHIIQKIDESIKSFK